MVFSVISKFGIYSFSNMDSIAYLIFAFLMGGEEILLLHFDFVFGIWILFVVVALYYCYIFVIEINLLNFNIFL